MPRYYNKTRGPLPLSLPSGPCVAPAKGYIEIARSDEGCVSVVRFVKKGFLVPPKVRHPVAPIVKSEPAPAPMPEPVVVKEEPEEEPAQLSPSSEVEKSDEPSKKKKGSSRSGKKTTKKRTRR